MDWTGLARWQWGLVGLLSLYLIVMGFFSAVSTVDVAAQALMAPIISYLVILIPAVLYRGVKSTLGRLLPG